MTTSRTFPVLFLLWVLAAACSSPVSLSPTPPPTHTPVASAIPSPVPSALPQTPTTGVTPTTAGPDSWSVERAFPSLDFEEATGVVQASDGSNRLFVVEQAGRIVAFHNQEDSAQASVFLDIRPVVSTQHNEEGLLGLAFHPEFRDNGYLYVYHSASSPRRNILARYTAASDRQTAQPSSRLVLLESPKPFGNHNGGQLAFGPDGFLYVSVGDGGGDNRASAQSTSDLLGSILRIDVDAPSAQRPYGIPADNPFLGTGGARQELWAIGLRNPWRFSFDPATGELWIADVGEVSREEIDIGRAGANYGWPIMEASRCLGSASSCARTDLAPPIWEYAHADGCSVTGGHVVHDPRLPSLGDAYIFADYCSGKVWALRRDGEAAAADLLLDTDLNITSFGVTLAGELMIVSRDEGLYRLVAGSW